MGGIETPFVNIAAYRFAALEDLPARKSKLLEHCNRSHLKGTILLSPEGINLFVAGAADAVEALLAELRSWPGLSDLKAKVSHTAAQPFRRMLVRIKKEIIAFGVTGIDPAKHTSAKIAPAELKRWLDEGRTVTLLDTRNDYEVKLGTFKNARVLGIDHFRHFPQRVRELPASLKNETIVMFCTGGIRCEKAGPLMEREGFNHVFQLDGGILKYFEDCGAAHYEGECFVFDQRVGVNTQLQESDAEQCFNCQEPLRAADQNDPRYVPGESCPACHRTPAQRMAAAIAQRQERIRQICAPLPGSCAADQFKPINVPRDCDGGTLLQALCSVVRQVPEAVWEAQCAMGLVLDADKHPVALSRRVRAGERYLHKFAAVIEPAVNADIRILHEDESLIVINKPAPLPMHAGGRFYRNTLQFILSEAYRPQKPRPAHRLDGNTTGLVLVTRTRTHASRLQPQFARGDVTKVYLARVQGHPPQDAFLCDAPISTDAGKLGSRCVDWDGGLAARTEFRVLERCADGTSLLEVRPSSGRTNQIRVHLWHLGWPVCGDPAYREGRTLGGTQTLDPQDAPLQLHAWQLRFRHPQTWALMDFTAPPPAWAGHAMLQAT